MDTFVDINFETSQDYIDLDIIEMMDYAEQAADLDAQYYGEYY